MAAIHLGFCSQSFSLSFGGGDVTNRRQETGVGDDRDEEREGEGEGEADLSQKLKIDKKFRFFFI